MSDSKQRLEWFHVHQAVDFLARRIRCHTPSMNVTSIVAIARGGLIPAGLLAKILDVENFVSYGVSSYEKENQGKFNVYQPLPKDFGKGLTGDVLIVDDLAHTGKTFLHVKEEILKHNPTRNFNLYTAAPYLKTGAEYKPDIWITEIPEETWLEFPWET